MARSDQTCQRLAGDHCLQAWGETARQYGICRRAGRALIGLTASIGPAPIAPWVINDSTTVGRSLHLAGPCSGTPSTCAWPGARWAAAPATHKASATANASALVVCGSYGLQGAPTDRQEPVDPFDQAGVHIIFKAWSGGIRLRRVVARDQTERFWWRPPYIYTPECHRYLDTLRTDSPTLDTYADLTGVLLPRSYPGPPQATI